MSLAISPPRLAEHLGLPAPTVQRWALQWHGPVGKGHYRTLDHVDVMVAVAWHDLNHDGKGHGAPAMLAARREAERAIRAHPAPWLVVWPGPAAATFDTQAAAVAAWGNGPDGVARLVHLELPEVRAA